MMVSVSDSVEPQESPWLVIGEHEFRSRLLIGVEQYKSSALASKVLTAAQADVIITTFDLDGSQCGFELSALEQEVSLEHFIVIGTTSFARSAEDAFTVAQLLRQTLGIQIVKLDVRREDNTPENETTIRVAKQLITDGFYILPLIVPDVRVATELEEVGCKALRVMAGPIASGKGITKTKTIEKIIARASIPIVLEGGLGMPSHAALAMELGADAVLVNTAIAQADEPVMMASAMMEAVHAGRRAYLATRIGPPEFNLAAVTVPHTRHRS